MQCIPPSTWPTTLYCTVVLRQALTFELAFACDGLSILVSTRLESGVWPGSQVQAARSHDPGVGAGPLIIIYAWAGVRVWHTAEERALQATACYSPHTNGTLLAARTKKMQQIAPKKTHTDDK